MHVSFVDCAGSGLGVAIGLVELGHRVDYVGPEPWPDQAIGEVDRVTGELIVHFFGRRALAPDLDAELLVLQDGVADWLHALTHRDYVDSRHDPGHPMRPTCNPLIYPIRLAHWVEWCERASRTCVVDCSDRSAPREPALSMLPRVSLLTRELPRAEASAWRPLPFLYNPVLLWFEKLRPRREWRQALPTPPEHDWVFCGTVDHPRYGNDRRRRIAEVRARWPRLFGRVATHVSFLDVLALLQSSRLCLDLPGAGELCFRLHESLALGVPVLRPWPYSIAMAAGVESAIVDDADAREIPSPEAVRAIYERSYAPHVAAAVLLAAAPAHLPAAQPSLRDSEAPAYSPRAASTPIA